MKHVVLHVEDEAPVRERVQKILSGADIQVVSVASIEEAEHITSSLLFDVVLCDSDMNRLEGATFALSLAERSEERPGEKVVLLSDKHQFRKMPFISKGLLPDAELFKREFRKHLV